MSQNGSFTLKTSTLGTARALHDIVVYNDKVFVVGGTTDSGAAASGGTSRIDVARILGDGTLSTFSTIGNLPAARLLSASVCTDDGFIVTVGGQDTSGTAQQTVYVTDLNTDGSAVVSSVASTNFPKATMTGHAMAVTPSRWVYVVGGGAATQTDVYYTNISQNGVLGVWKQTTSHPVDLSFAGVVSDGNFLWTVGGLKNTGSVVQTACYRAKINNDGTLQSWVKLNDLTIPRHRHGCFLFNGRIYASYGAQTTVATNAVSSKEFAVINADGSLSAWTTTGPGQINIRNARTVLGNGLHVFTPGGFDGTNALASIQKGTLQHDGHI